MLNFIKRWKWVIAAATFSLLLMVGVGMLIHTHLNPHNSSSILALETQRYRKHRHNNQTVFITTTTNTPTPKTSPTLTPTKPTSTPTSTKIATVMITASPTPTAQQNTSTNSSLLALMNEAGQGLINTHISANGGWAWKSVIQAPHLQTDRDVGASSIAMGLLALWETTHNSTYLSAAANAGNWLLSVAQQQGNSLSWPDYADSTSNVSGDNFTSFDDGTMGIADLLWRLGQDTGNTRYTNAAIEGVQWEMNQALSPSGKSCPSQMCLWHWSNNDPSIQIGMGEGNAGIIEALDIFAERTGNTTYDSYAKAGAAYLESQMTSAGAMPEVSGDTTYDTGFLSGASGEAFMFLRLYQHLHNPQYLTDAQKLLSWVTNQQVAQPHGITWPLMIDPSSGNDTQYATGIEEGNAGIGWVFLQAYKVTSNSNYLTTAKQAGDWLVAMAKSQNGGVCWPEDYNPTSSLTHTSLDNGAPGIGWFLHDLSIQSGISSYDQTAQSAIAWLTNVGTLSGGAVYWSENLNVSTWNLYQEPSWHWGSAGIAGFLARMAGWTNDIPGEESGL